MMARDGAGLLSRASCENQPKYHIWRHMACNLGGWRAEPSMAIPVVHIAPLGTNAVDARGMARWLSGGGLMVVSGGTGLYRHVCTCRIQCQQSMRPWLHSGGARPHGSQRHQSG